MNIVISLAPKLLYAHLGFKGIFCIISLYILFLFNSILEIKCKLSIFYYFYLVGIIIKLKVGNTY